MGLVATQNVVYRGIPKELVVLLRDRFIIDRFIETGTYTGETALWASAQFKNVTTFEAAKELYDQLQMKDLPENLNAVFGDSSALIGNYIDGKALYYLDAHYSSGNTFSSYPLLLEVKAINQKPFDDFIIIDDARFVLSKWNNERYCTLAELLNELSHKNRYTVVFDDMIISVPDYAQSTIDEYTNNASQFYWQSFLQGSPLTTTQKFKKLIPLPIKHLIKNLINNRG